MTIPRLLYTFWHTHDLPEFIEACICAFHRAAPGWKVVVLHADEQILPPPPVAADRGSSSSSNCTLTPAQLSDWYRLTALRQTGGVYLDASCLALGPPEMWVDVSSAALQGFACRLDGETMESWAIAAAPGDPLLGAWHDEYAKAIRNGVGRYCEELDARGLISDGLRCALPYLAIHAAWRAARASLPEAALQLRSSVEKGAPFYYLRLFGWDSLAAVSAIFAADAGEEILEGCPFVKLRRCERECVPPLAALGRASWLAKRLVGEEEEEAEEHNVTGLESMNSASLAVGAGGGGGSKVSSRIEWLLSR